jgi:integrase/recombinase XerD
MPVSPPVDLIEAWLQYLEINRGRSPQTVIKYGQYLRRLASWLTATPSAPHLGPATGAKVLCEVTTADLRVFAGVYAHSLKLSAAARKPLVSALKSFFAWCVAAGHMAEDPAIPLESPKAGKRLPRAASLDWVGKLLQGPDLSTFRGVRDALILVLLTGCGMRVSGVCGLNDSSLVWTVDDMNRERLSIRVLEKGKRERLVPAPDECAMLMRAYLAHPELQAIDRSLPSADAVLLVSTMPNGSHAPHDWHGEARRIHRRTVLDMIERYAKRLKLDLSMAHPHALRHLYGTELAESDVDVIQRGALLGHQDARTTEIYTQLAQRKLRKVVDQANPLGKLRTPLLDSLRALSRASTVAPKGASVGPNAARNA